MRLYEAVEALVVCYPPCVKGGCPENIQHMERLARNLRSNGVDIVLQLASLGST